MNAHARALSFGFCCALLLGCASIPEGRFAVNDIDVEGNEHVPASDLQSAMATLENQRFLGLFQGIVYDYSIFNQSVLERDLARIERHYRGRGFYEARVEAARITRVGDDEVRVDIVIDEGLPIRVASVQLDGFGKETHTRHYFASMMAAYTRLEKDDLFVEEDFEAAASAIERVLKNGGHAWAVVRRDATVDLVRHVAHVTYTVDAGPVAELGQVTIEGLGDLDEEIVRDTLNLAEGDTYSRDDLDDAEQALLELGVFASANIEAEVGKGPPNEPPYRVPLVVKVAPTHLRRVQLGGGVRLDALEADVHGLAAWESRNFLGGLRKFRVEARPGLTLYPLRVNNWAAPDKPLPKGKVRVRLEQPSLFEARTRGIVEATGSAYPVFLNTDPGPDDPVLGYVSTHGIVGVERRMWRIFGAVRQHIEYSLPFAYIGTLDPLLRDIVLGYPEIAVTLDLRDDPVNPHEGFYANLTTQSALFLDGRDIKLAPEVRGYVPIGSKVTIAARAGVGMLFPFNYADTLEALLADPAGADSAEEVRDVQLMYFRGLFGGGPGSNRGYPPRTLAPHGVVPFLTPAAQTDQLASACASDDADHSLCSIPIGGLTLWELSLEVRYPIISPLSGAVFCDAADVSPARANFRFTHPHLSCGSGLRYDTPVGPIRLDVAYRIPGAQVLNGKEGTRMEGDPGTIFGAPINISFGVGESF